MIRRSFGMLSLIALNLCVMIAQESTGHLEGRVVDSLSTPLPGATITVSSPSLQGIRGTASDENGYFHIVALPVGRYIVKVSHVAYQEVSYENVPIRLGKTNTLGNLEVHSNTLEMSEVVVSGAKPVIDATSTTIGGNLESSAFTTFPTDRNFRSIISLLPEANTSYIGDETNISGSTGNENVYFIDGINVTDPMTAKTSTNIPYNFVREIEVKTGGYEAEYTSALGGVANVVTQSGGNDIHGQLFGFYTNNSLSEDPKIGTLGNTIGDYTVYDVGFSIGGPIVRDRLWYFAAYNPAFENKDVEITGLGLYPDQKRVHSFSGKLTWQASTRTNFTLSIIGDPGTEDFVTTTATWLSGITTVINPDPLLRKETTGGVNGSLLAHHMVSDKFMIDGSVSVFTRKDDDQPGTERGYSEPMYLDYVNGTASGGWPFEFIAHTSRISAQVSASLFLGPHTFKGGLGYEDNSLDGRYSHSTFPVSPFGIFRRGDSLYEAAYSYRVPQVSNRIPSAFLQDSWVATEGLRLNAGLRWTAEFFEGSDGELAQRITDEFQPRIGFTWQPGKSGSRKLFGSYGRYYEQIPLFLSASYHTPLDFFSIFYDHNPIDDPSGGDTLTFSNKILPEVSGLEGQHFDEFILGYEQRIGDDFKLGIRGIYRNLLQVVEDGYDTSAYAEGIIGSVVGNPGEGALSFLPRFTRQYRAVELTFQRTSPTGLNLLASYVLSRNYGNYPGLYSSDYQWGNVNASPFDTPDQAPNSDGTLPNDRPHVFKLSASYPFSFGLTAGSSFILQSGTPLNDFGQSILYEYIFLQPRGSVGRTPTIWDWNVRLSYDLSLLAGSGFRPRLILDAFHLFSQRKAVDVDQVHYTGRDESGNPIDPNPNYLMTKSYQPPMSLRLGVEVNF